jgi:hypothetical protein
MKKYGRRHHAVPATWSARNKDGVMVTFPGNKSTVKLTGTPVTAQKDDGHRLVDI